MYANKISLLSVDYLDHPLDYRLSKKPNRKWTYLQHSQDAGLIFDRQIILKSKVLLILYLNVDIKFKVKNLNLHALYWSHQQICSNSNNFVELENKFISNVNL